MVGVSSYTVNRRFGYIQRGSPHVLLIRLPIQGALSYAGSRFWTFNLVDLTPDTE